MSRDKSIDRPIDRTIMERQALLSTRKLIDHMRASYRELERLTGAPVSLHRALTAIHVGPGITASLLATSLGMKRPAVSHVLKDLASRGWIERVRKSQDQRSVQLFLTQAGQRIIKATGGKASGRLQRALRQLSDSQLQGLANSMPALVKFLDTSPSTTARTEPPVGSR